MLIRQPEAVNILTAMGENQRIVANENDPEREAIALAWLFHLIGDIHQPLHAAQLFTVDYPQVIKAEMNLYSGDESRPTNGPTQVLGWG